MNYILMDIKNFLKKLETGQLEIEAGQWELHKDITNLKSSMQGLKQLKKDLQQMKFHGLTQTNLIKELQCKIKELQCKINALEKNHDNRQWSSASTSTQAFDKTVKQEWFPKARKRFKKHSNIILRSGKVVGRTSKSSINRSQSVNGYKPKNEKEFLMSKEAKQKSHGHGGSCPSYKKLKSRNGVEKLPKTPPLDHSILQRYLQDSARYIEKDAPRMSYISSKKSSQNQTLDEDFGRNCAAHKSNLDQHDHKAEVSVKSRKISSIPKKFFCSECPKKFAFKSTFLKHQRKHRNSKPFYSCNVCNKRFLGKNRLKKHEKIHQKTVKSFRGYKCSYCDKTCKTPEKLTEHLKSCRIIKKTDTHKI